MAKSAVETYIAPAAAAGPNRMLTTVLPLGLFCACYGFAIWAELSERHMFAHLIYAEGGLMETAEVLTMALALGVAVTIVFDERTRLNRGLLAWTVMFVLGAIYVVGEETSWGQAFAQWTTPEWLAELNDQQETNLHNISSWFDQKPRLLLELGVIVGGILHPILQRLRGHGLLARPWWLMPTAAGLVTGVLAEITMIPGRLAKWGVLPHSTTVTLWDEQREVSFLILRDSELQEFFFYYFILLYLLSLRHRLRVAAS